MIKTPGQLPFCVSITGADDAVHPADLFALQQKYPFVEWALLWFPEKEGAARNPSRVWREAFLATCEGAQTALHLCGPKTFRDILEGKIPAEFSRYGRLQLNINARRQDFTSDEVLTIYTRLAEAGHRLILQYHEASSTLITEFLWATTYRDQIDVLFDASRGTGKRPDTWPSVDRLPDGTCCGYAGGLNPDNIAEVLVSVQTQAAMPQAYWLDMESGVRTNNWFDLGKVDSVLAQVARAQA